MILEPIDIGAALAAVGIVVALFAIAAWPWRAGR